MVDLLRRSLAPLTEKSWQEIDSTAARVIRSQITARDLVDFDGPHGWDLAAINLGRLDTSPESTAHDVPWGTRAVLPLVEARIPFQLNQMELDSIARGAKDADLDSLEVAARRIALFEETAIYNGCSAAGIEGMVPASAQTPITLSQNMEEFPKAVARAVETMSDSGITGPFILVLGPDVWASLMQSGAGGYPPQRIIRNLIEDSPRTSPVVEGGLLISTAEGNFELTVGQDFSIGYASHDREGVELYLTESFTFRVLEPKAVLHFAPA